MNWLSIPWGAFLRAFRLHALVLTTAVFLGGALFWGAFNGSLEITNTETFCISCHAMKEYVFKEYRNSGQPLVHDDPVTPDVALEGLTE